jgi:hypothetical protein
VPSFSITGMWLAKTVDAKATTITVRIPFRRLRSTRLDSTYGGVPFRAEEAYAVQCLNEMEELRGRLR